MTFQQQRQQPSARPRNIGGSRFHPVDGNSNDLTRVDNILDMAQNVLDQGVVNPPSYSNINGDGSNDRGINGSNASVNGNEFGRRMTQSFSPSNNHFASPNMMPFFQGGAGGYPPYHGNNNDLKPSSYQSMQGGCYNNSHNGNRQNDSNTGFNMNYPQGNGPFHHGMNMGMSMNMNAMGMNARNMNSMNMNNHYGYGNNTPVGNLNTHSSVVSFDDDHQRPAKRTRVAGPNSNDASSHNEMFPSPSYALSEFVAPMRQKQQEDTSDTRFRSYQSDAWTERLEELQEFKKATGHCLVPHNYEKSIQLAQWVKRQRYQYKLKNEGRHSTLSQDRLQTLEDLGFVWDSHGAAWQERFHELTEFKSKTGHCNVPSSFPENPALSVWVKCQRRQYKLMRGGKKSNMNQERADKLSCLGFIWNPRKLLDGYD